ncbi:MAG: FtsQ-type POTRA domain-containing protein [Firmicutes bacterium]|nr:FtsQ-type POTRA domain-containing protein [Bacillota bacterium]
MRRDNRTENGIKKKKRRKKRYLLKFAVFLALCGIAAAVAHINYFDVTEIDVKGNKDISDEEIISLSKVQTGRSIFDANSFFVKRRIKGNLYIEKVSMKRELPDRIVINVTEKTGLAQFAFGKKYVVTDNEGEVIEVSKEMKSVTLVENIKINGAEKGKDIKTEKENLLDKALSLIRKTEKNDLYFSRINIDGNKFQGVFFGDLSCRGEYDEVVKSIESGTLKSVVYDLYQKGREKGIITVESNGYCFFTPQK